MNNKAFFSHPGVLYFLLLLSGVAYYLLAYQTVRDNFLQVISLFTLLFTVYFAAYHFFSKTHFNYLLIAGILFRLLLLFSVPNLSNDVYRFIWDGRLAANGINPFSHLPGEIMQMEPVPGLTNELFGLLNSPDHFTIYPPVMQGVFWVAAKLFPVNTFAALVFMKCFIFLVELGTVYLLIQILKKLSLPKSLSLFYILNPLVITELTGNVHFDGVMIFFVLLAYLFYLKNNWKVSAICMGLGIASKLLPVLFLPLLVWNLGWKKGIMYSVVTMITTLVLFGLLFDAATIKNLLNSVDLFIRHFEFNASVYYIVRWIGTQVAGYNIIAQAGPALILIATGIIFFLSFRDKKQFRQALSAKLLLIITTWYIFSTTVHPWYICLPVALAVFTPYRYALIWSFTATLSYSAYQYIPVQENLWLVGSGYIFMISYALWELKKKNFPDNKRKPTIDTIKYEML